MTYLDSAATSQKPQVVLDALQDYYVNQNANVHRGLYRLAYQTTESYEAVRQQVATMLHAASADEIIFTAGTTASLNLVASSFGPQFVQPGDEILVSGAEHHSNFIPWQQLALRTGAKFVVAPVQANGDIDSEALLKAITPKTKLLAVAQVTNVTGSQADLKALTQAVHQVGGVVVVDGAQAVPHLTVDVQALDADFYAFSGHKVFGPTGIGALYAKAKWQAQMPPIAFGGEMIDMVEDQSSTWAEGPLKYEAGTPNIAGVIGLGAALAFKQQLPASAFENEQRLVVKLWRELDAIDGVQVYGTPEAIGAVSFNLAGVHPHDLATYLDEADIAVRAGHHCAQPLMARLGVPATVRASFSVYNQEADVAALVAAVKQARGYFNGVE